MSNTTTLCVVASAVSLLAFIYPYVIYPLVLRLLPKHISKAPTPKAGQSPDSIALLFCAYNEEHSLPDKIANLGELKASFPEMEILAYSDCSDDATNDLLMAASDILTPVLGTQRRGKVLGMQHLVSKTEADILVFTDANVIVEPHSISRILHYFTDPEIGTVGGTLIYQDADASDTETVAKVGGLYWKLEEHIKKLETRSGSMMGADGSLFARRRDGYPAIPSDLVDDMAVSMDTIIHGLRCISAADVVGYENSVSSSTEEFLRKRRIACGSYSTYRFQRSQLQGLSRLNRFKYFSHKLIRWYGAFLLLSAAVFFLAACALSGQALLAISVLALGSILILAGKFGVPVLSTVYELLSAILATAIGIVESLSGSSYQTWNPAKSR